VKHVVGATLHAKNREGAMRGQAVALATQLGRARHVSKIRAYAMWSVVDVIRMKFGASGLHEIRMRLTSERREQFRSLPGQSAWFDYGLYLDVLKSAVERFYGGDPYGAFDLSRAAKHLDVKRMFETMGMFDSPRSFVSQLRSLRRHYLDGGEMDGALVGPNVLRFRLSGLVSSSDVASHDAAGGVAGMLEMSGAGAVRLLEMQSTTSSCTAWIGFEHADHGVM
jgi:hypothetical protein